jgi:hypothetical protein
MVASEGSRDEDRYPGRSGVFPAGIALADEREHREHAPAIKLLE